VEHAAHKVRTQGLVARRIYYFLKTQEFRYHRYEIPLTNPVQTPNTIMEEIKKTFDAVFHFDTPYRATGVTLSGLIPENIEQNDLFGEGVKKHRWNDIFNTVDAIDRRYGTHTVTLASSLKANTKRGTKPHKHLIIPFMGETQ
jgi:DNA polymerase V